MINEHLISEFGQRIKQLRNQKNISQEKLSFSTGFHRTYIGMIERAEKNITLINIEKLSKALDTPLSKLLEDL